MNEIFETGEIGRSVIPLRNETVEERPVGVRIMSCEWSQTTMRGGDEELFYCKSDTAIFHALWRDDWSSFRHDAQAAMHDVGQAFHLPGIRERHEVVALPGSVVPSHHESRMASNNHARAKVQ